MSSVSPGSLRGGFLTKVGDPTRIQATEDYSITPAVFEKVVPEGETWRIRRMIGHIVAPSQMRPEVYGDFAGRLSNGITVRIADGSGNVLSLLTNGFPVLANADWGAQCYDVNNLGTGLAGADAYVFRWTFANDYGVPIRLLGSEGHRIQVAFNDNFSGLEEHAFKVTAIKE